MGDSITTAERSLARLEDVDKVLAKGLPPKAAAADLARAWGVKPRHAMRYVKLALDRWGASASPEDRERSRAQLRAKMWGLVEAAEGRTRGFVDSKGEYHEQPDPDIRGAAMVVDMLCRLDGAYEQPGGGNTTVVLGDSAVRSVTEAMLGREIVDATPDDG